VEMWTFYGMERDIDTHFFNSCWEIQVGKVVTVLSNDRYTFILLHEKKLLDI